MQRTGPFASRIYNTPMPLRKKNYVSNLKIQRRSEDTWQQHFFFPHPVVRSGRKPINQLACTHGTWHMRRNTKSGCGSSRRKLPLTGLERRRRGRYEFWSTDADVDDVLNSASSRWHMELTRLVSEPTHVDDVLNSSFARWHTKLI